jgi:hypothetical protein
MQRLIEIDSDIARNPLAPVDIEFPPEPGNRRGAQDRN